MNYSAEQKTPDEMNPEEEFIGNEPEYEDIQTYLSWHASGRPYKRHSVQYFTNSALILMAVEIILFLFSQYLLHSWLLPWQLSHRLMFTIALVTKAYELKIIILFGMSCMIFIFCSIMDKKFSTSVQKIISQENLPLFSVMSLYNKSNQFFFVFYLFVNMSNLLLWKKLVTGLKKIFRLKVKPNKIHLFACKAPIR